MTRIFTSRSADKARIQEMEDRAQEAQAEQDEAEGREPDLSKIDTRHMPEDQADGFGGEL